MADLLADLKPQAVWSYFSKLCEIPRGSGKEAEVSGAIAGWARERGCETGTDAVGNLVVRIPATAGMAEAPGVVLQGHLDMVQEKNRDVVFDFDRDPIALRRDGDWISATGTTLGADNGIGVATALSFMDLRNLSHGPIELLLTVDEESGLKGARNLSADFIRGRLLVNVDSEEDGIFYIGCSGGRDSAISLPLERVPSPPDQVGFSVEVKGLRGGHSGLDIVRNRGNALRLLADLLAGIDREAPIALADLEGGDKHNAIPREATAVFTVSGSDKEAVRRAVDVARDSFLAEYGAEEPGFRIALCEISPPPRVLSRASAHKALRLLRGLPNGVLAMMRDLPGTVETSTNLARARIAEGDRLEILNSTRSPVRAAIDRVIGQIEAVAGAAGAAVEVDAGYPGWRPNPDSPLLARAMAVWAEVHREKPVFRVIHAGLECGIIGEKFRDMDMISIGPTVLHAHSPEEKVSISSVARFFAFVTALVESLTKR